MQAIPKANHVNIEPEILHRLWFSPGKYIEVQSEPSNLNTFGPESVQISERFGLLTGMYHMCIIYTYFTILWAVDLLRR